ncbi:DoxX-like family protein [Metapseudomonas otitidis]|uniref:DoxX-like family protein n=1 Tax=Metapseudomonas otitidis TaxID=319939 RepID=UPI001F3177BE|nr:DoxX-like family protein [Pseudomonas otitidis]
MASADPRLYASLARWGLALLFLYHGIVPKLLWLSPGELEMIRAHGFEQARLLAALAGVAEVVLALALLVVRRRRWPLALSALALVGLLVDVAMVAPGFLVQAFNPVSTNLTALFLCAIGWLAEHPENPQSVASSR